MIDRVRETRNFAFWHSATFSNSGRTVVFTDELGGGGAPECNKEVGRKVPVEGRDILVQAWYQGGTSGWEFTDPRKPTELAHFDRDAISDSELVLGGSWSSYWYNGYVYSSDITRGLEAFKVRAPWATKASKVKQSVFNPQSQPSFNG